MIQVKYLRVLYASLTGSLTEICSLAETRGIHRYKNTQVQGTSNEGQGKIKTISARVGYIDKATDIFSRRE